RASRLGRGLPGGITRNFGEPLAHTHTGLARAGKMLRGSDALRERTGLVVGAFDRPRRRRIRWHPGSISICRALPKRTPRPAIKSMPWGVPDRPGFNSPPQPTARAAA